MRNPFTSRAVPYDSVRDPAQHTPGSKCITTSSVAVSPIIASHQFTLKCDPS